MALILASHSINGPIPNFLFLLNDLLPFLLNLIFEFNVLLFQPPQVLVGFFCLWVVY